MPSMASIASMASMIWMGRPSSRAGSVLPVPPADGAGGPVAPGPSEQAPRSGWAPRKPVFVQRSGGGGAFHRSKTGSDLVAPRSIAWVYELDDPATTDSGPPAFCSVVGSAVGSAGGGASGGAVRGLVG